MGESGIFLVSRWEQNAKKAIEQMIEDANNALERIMSGQITEAAVTLELNLCQKSSGSCEHALDVNWRDKVWTHADMQKRERS